MSLEEHFLQAFFPVSFFLRPRRKYIGKKKKTRRNSVNENSIKVRRNTSPHERWKNYAKLRQSQTYPKSAKLKCYPILKFQSINTGKDFKISKKTGLIGMAHRWILVQVTNIYRPSGMWDNLTLDSFDLFIYWHCFKSIQWKTVKNN